MNHRYVAPLAFIAAILALVGCARKPPEPVKTPPPVVIVERPVVQKVNEYEDFAGHTEPYRVVELKSRVTGYLKKIHFKDGQDIAEGKKLFDIDDRQYKAELDKAHAALSKAEKRLKTVSDNFIRVKTSYENGVEGKEKYDLALGEKLEAETDVEAGHAAVELAQTNLDYCRIHAPFDGRLSKRLVDEENLVKADETLLTTIVRLDMLYATFDVDERTAPRVTRLIQKGELLAKPLPVQLALGDDDFEIIGHVVFVDNQINASTGTLRLRAEVPNPKRDMAARHALLPGQFVRVRVPIGEPRDAVLVPEKAIGSDQGQRFLYVVNAENTVERRNIRVGQQYGTLRVVEGGVVSPSDRIIVDGLLRVRPGAEVNPKLAPPQPQPKFAPPPRKLEVAPPPRAK